MVSSTSGCIFFHQLGGIYAQVHDPTSYTGDGTKGLLKEGGTKRRATVEANVKSAGGKLEAFYFAFGEADAFVIVDLPDNASAAALSMAVNASGAVALKTHVLLTPEEIDQATKKSVQYRAPGKA